MIRWEVNESTHLPIPAEWGDKSIDGNKNIYWHGTVPYLASSFRKYGLLPSWGTGSEKWGPQLYT